MLRLAFISFLLFVFFQPLFAEFEDINATAEENLTQFSQQIEPIKPKVLYLSYLYTPKRLIKGEIFKITIKTLSVIKNFTDITYKFDNEKDIKLLEPSPKREQNGRYFYDTFYFQATGLHVRTPDITAMLIDDLNSSYRTTTLNGKKIDTIALHQRDDFSHIIAKDFIIKKYKTTVYDNTHNIVLFSAEANQTRLQDFHLKNVTTQGFESIEDTINASKMIYYAVIDNTKENLIFSYFNIGKNDFIKLAIPIIVDDDKVATQSDLNPHDQSKQRIKIILAASIIVIGLILFLIRRKFFYLFLVILPLIYLILLLGKQQTICIKPNSNIRILPLKNSTIFEITKQKLLLKKIGSTKGFVKVEFKNNKIGWIQDEDLCSN